MRLFDVLRSAARSKGNSPPARPPRFVPARRAILATILNFVVCHGVLAQQSPPHPLEAGIGKQLRGDFDGAIADFDQAIELAPDRPDIYFDRALAKEMQNDLVGAVADFDQAIALNPQHASLYCVRGIAKQYLGKLDEARADYDQAIAINPQLAVPMAFAQASGLTTMIEKEGSATLTRRSS
jgi:tetratricopeptide (TPR) repeat protein